jgi:hypothetical protein
MMIENGKITLRTKIILILPSAVILFLNPKYAFIYLIIFFSGIFIFQNLLAGKNNRNKQEGS